MRKKSLIVLSVLSIVASVGVSVWAVYADFEKSFYLTAALVIIFAFIPFFAFFEGRKIKTTEIVVLSVMISVSVISRLIFSFVPEVKPMAAFVFVTGMAFGANAGFVTGALSIFVSNCFLGQGAFTPFQMLGMGLVGFVAGLFFYEKEMKGRKVLSMLIAALTVLIVYGFIVDSCAVLMMATDFSFASVFAIYSSGFLFNVIHALTTAVVLFFISTPMNNKFERLRIKYGVFERSGV